MTTIASIWGIICEIYTSRQYSSGCLKLDINTNRHHELIGDEFDILYDLFCLWKSRI